MNSDREYSLKLFGSRAEGKSRPDSDWDFLVSTNPPLNVPSGTTWGSASIHLPEVLPPELVEQAKGIAGPGARFDLFVEFRQGNTWQAALYDESGRPEWDHAHDCLGGWLPPYREPGKPPRRSRPGCSPEEHARTVGETSPTPLVGWEMGGDGYITLRFDGGSQYKEWLPR